MLSPGARLLSLGRTDFLFTVAYVPLVLLCSWCATELTGFKGIYSAREGASTAVFLATAPRESLCPPSDPIRAYSGRFYVNCAPCLEFERDWAGAMPLQRGETPSSVRPFTESPAGTVFTRSTAATPYPTTTPMPDTVNSPDMRSDSASAATGKS